jgi:hypothetical protein
MPGRPAADEAFALAAEPDAGRVDHQRRARQAGGAVEREHRAAARMHRQRDAGQRRHRRRPRARGVDDRVGRQALAVVSEHGVDAVALALEAADARTHPARAQAARLGGQRPREGVAIEPAFARLAQRGQRHVAGVQPRKASGQRSRRQQPDGRAQIALQRVVARQNAAITGGKEQVARGHEADVDRRVVHAQPVLRARDQLMPELRHAHVDRRRELLPNGAGR